MADNKKATVVVLSRNLTTGLSVVRSLGAAGHTVDLIANVEKTGKSEFIAKSKYVNETIEVCSKSDKNGEDGTLIYALLKYAAEKEEELVLLPTDEYTTLVVDQHYLILEPHFALPSVGKGKNGSITRHMDRSVQAALAREAGIATPIEWILPLNASLDIPKKMVYPCFVKPMDSLSGYVSDFSACNDEEELMTHLRNLKNKNSDRSVIVQEFLEIDDEFVVSGVCLGDNVIVPGAIKKLDLAQHSDRVPITGEVVSFDVLGESKERILSMLKSLNYTGLFNIEFIVSNGVLYFCEINFYSNILDYAYFENGVNLPDLYAKGVLGTLSQDDSVKVQEPGKGFVYEIAAWTDYIRQFITREELEAYLTNDNTKFIINEDDSDPEFFYFKQIVAVNRIPGAQVKTSMRGRIRDFKGNFKTFLRNIKYTILGYPQMKPENQRNPESEFPRVVVLGRNYCSNLTMARGIGKAGYEVEILRIFQRKPKFRNVMKWLKPDAYSKYVKAYRVCVSRRSSRVVKMLKKMADPDRRMLLIPTDDYTAHIADMNYDALSPYYMMPNVEGIPGEISRLMSKEVQTEMARAAGLPVLNSCVIRTTCGMFTIPESVTYPCFIKPNISKNGSKTKMRRCDSEEELREVLTEYSEKKDIEFLVEDFVEIGREYSLLGVSTKEGVNGPGFFMAEEGGVNEHRGVALIGKVLPCSTMQDLIDNLIKFIGTFNYTGLYDVDLIETVDGKVYFVEVNMRFGGSGYSITESGINLPGMFADYMLKGTPIDLNCKLEDEDTGKRFISEKILIEEYEKGRLSMGKIRESMAATDIQFVKCADDPKPYKHFKRYYSFASLLNKKNRLAERKEAKLRAEEQKAL